MSDWLRAQANGATIGVDRDKGVIRGYVVAEKGIFKDRRGEFTDKSLSEVVRLGNERKAGLKVRFTHPNSSNDGLGKYLGRAKDFRLDGDLVRADLHFGKTAQKTPSGNLAEYVMSLAEEDPDAFASSLVLESEKKYRRDEDGAFERDEMGEVLPPVWIPQRLHASDVVDTGAATNSFLSADNAQPAELATEYLDELFQGQGREYCEQHLRDFADRYLSSKFPDGEEEKDVDVEKLKQELDARHEQLTGTVAKLSETVAALADAVTKREEKELAERTRSTEISSLCNLVGMSELASEYIESDKDLSTVRQELQEKRAKRDALLSEQGSGEGEDYSAYRAEYLAHKSTHEQLGVSLDEYIASRCEEDGKPAPAKK